MFISHRDIHKVEAKALAIALSDLGVSAFVAHDTIEPMSTWQREIEKGLATMEVMLIFQTDDLHESLWVNQEIGFALGKSIPIISLKLGTKDPQGFIAEKQALRGDINDPKKSAEGIYQILLKLGQTREVAGRRNFSVRRFQDFY